MTNLAYIIESCILTTCSFCLLVGFISQARIEYSFRRMKQQQRRGSFTSPLEKNFSWPVRVLQDVRLASLLCGLGGSSIATVLSLDPTRSNGVLRAMWLTDLLSRLVSFFIYWVGLSYCASALQASFAASKLTSGRGQRLTFRLFVLALFLYIPILLFTSVFIALDVGGPYVAPFVYLVYVLSVEVCCIASFDFSYYKFRKNAKSMLANVSYHAVNRASDKLKRIFMFMHGFGSIVMFYQFYWLASRSFVDPPTHDPEVYTISDQIALYLQIAIFAFVLHVFWRRGVRSQRDVANTLTTSQSSLKQCSITPNQRSNSCTVEEDIPAAQESLAIDVTESEDLHASHPYKPGVRQSMSLRAEIVEQSQSAAALNMLEAGVGAPAATEPSESLVEVA